MATYAGTETDTHTHTPSLHTNQANTLKGVPRGRLKRGQIHIGQKNFKILAKSPGISKSQEVFT